MLWQNGTATDLGTLGGLQAFDATAINNLGQIAGSGQTSTGAVHPGLRRCRTHAAWPPARAVAAYVAGAAR